jgi:membrane-associated protease RseP (regulator of RpoE activity)
MDKLTPMREEPIVSKERIIQIAVAVLVVATALLIWGMADRADAAPAESNTVIQITDDESGGNVYEVKSEGGKITILEDGEPLPEDRILRKGKTLILLDENGRAVFQALVGENGDIEYSENIRGSMRIPRVPRSPRMSGLYIGISAGRVDGALATQLGLEKGQGILVDRVFEDSPAAKAGLEKYDIISKIDGETVDSVGDLRSRLSKMEEGQSLSLTVLRSGKSREFTVLPEKRKGERVFYMGEAPELGDPPAPPEAFFFDEDGGWNVRIPELPENPGSVRFFGDDDDIAVYAPPTEFKQALQWREQESQEREAQLQEMEKRLERLEAMLQELIDQKQR